MSTTKSRGKATKKSTPQPKKADNKTVCLNDIVSDPTAKTSAFGVILDATGAYKTNDSTDYVTKFKIIDSSYNVDSKVDTHYKRFVHVFVYSDSPATAPRVVRVGDIIKMKNFDFRTYQNTEIKGVFVKGSSEWAVYDGRKNANMMPITNSKNDVALSGVEKDHIKSLREWSEEFYKKKSLKQMNWFGRDQEGKGVDTENTVLEIKDVDLTCKLLADVVFIVDDKIYHKLAFADETAKVYYAEYCGHFSGVEEGDVVKLRSISIIVSMGVRKVVFSNYSAALLLQKKSKDHDLVTKGCKAITLDKESLEMQQFEELHLDKMSKVQIGLNAYAFTTQGMGQVQTDSLRENFVKGFPILDNFDHGEDDFLYENNYGFKFFSKRGSSVLKRYSSGHYYAFKELMQIQDEINSNKESVETYQYQKFLVRGFILATEYDYIFQTAKLYSPSLNRVWDFDHHEQATKSATDLQVILHNVFYMKDQSIESEQRCFPVYLITFDGNPQYIFDLWKLLPDYLDVQKWLDLHQNRANKFSELMENLKAPQYFYDMVLQLMVNNQGKIYFRVCDTIFWFAN